MRHSRIADDHGDAIERLARRVAHRIPKIPRSFETDSPYLIHELRELLAAIARSDSGFTFLDPVERGEMASEIRQALPVSERALFDSLLASREREIAAHDTAL